MSELAKINPSLIFKKSEEDENTLNIKAISNCKSVCYFLDAPIDYFGFESKSFSVINFNKVVSYYDTFNHPSEDANKNETPVLSIEYNDDNEAVNLFIKSSKYNTSLKHRLANEDVIIKPTFNKVKFPSIDATFTFTESQQSNINSILKLIDADRMKYKFSGNKLYLTLFNTKTSDTYETEYELENEVANEFELVTLATGYSLLPKGEYKIEVSSAGIMGFHLNRLDDIKLTLYIAKERNG